MLEPILVFLGFFAAGLWSAAPSVTFGDAGEFSACAATLGLPHAPGYPAYVLLTKAFGVFLALGNWAYRTNVFSALCGAVALAILCAALKRLGLGRGARLFGVFLIGFCALWRYESAVTEVFALHALFISCVIWAVSRFQDRLFADKPSAALGLLFGLGCANHQTIILVFPAIAAEIWLSACRAQRGLSGQSNEFHIRLLARPAAIFAAFFILGLCAYIILPLRAAHVPTLDWDQPTTWARFWHMFLRKDYGSFSLTVNGAPTSGVASWIKQSGRYFRYSLRSLGPVAAALTLVGCAAWPKSQTSGARSRLSLSFPILLLVISGPFFLILGNPPFNAQVSSALHRFYLASWFGAAMLAAAGVQALEDLLPRRVGRFVIWALLACPIYTGAATLGSWNARMDFASYDYGRAILHSLPKSSSLYMDGGDDTFYSLAFLTLAQGLRPDVDLHDRGGLVFPNPYGPDFRDLPKAMKEERRDAVEGLLAREGRLYYSALNSHLLPGFTLEPQGLLYYPDNRTPSNKKITGKIDQALWTIYPERWNMDLLRSHYRDRALVAVYPAMRAAGLARRDEYSQAISCLREAWLLAPDALWVKSQIVYQLGVIAYFAAQKSLWPQAQDALLSARAVDPDNPDTLCNLGVSYERSGKPQEAAALYKEAALKNPGWARAYYNLGALDWKLKRWKEAAQALSQASRLNPSEPAWAALASQAAARAR